MAWHGCGLTEQLAIVLDDGTGRIRPERVPLAELLQSLARAQTPLTHDGLSTLTPAKSVTYVPDLLIECEVLAPVDRFLLLFQTWLETCWGRYAAIRTRPTTG